MTVNSQNGQCQCGTGQYLDQIQGICQTCQSKCSTCSNWYSCDIYQNCPNSVQTLNQQGKCIFNCSSGVLTAPNICSPCSDINCNICTIQGNLQKCGLCKAGYYLNLQSYTCVLQCPSNSFSISTTNAQLYMSQTINYCRPFTNNITNMYSYYVDSSSQEYIELGTFEFPFKNIQSPFLEVYNFMFNRSTQFNVYIKKGTLVYQYTLTIGLFVLNIQQCTVNEYGDSSLPKPIVMFTDIELLQSDSTWVSIGENDYNNAIRISNNDMKAEEQMLPFRFQITRSNFLVQNIEFQSIMLIPGYFYIGLVELFVNYGFVAQIDNCIISTDAYISDSWNQIMVAIIFTNNIVNITQLNMAFFLRFDDDCIAWGVADKRGFLIMENNTFFGINEQAILGFIEFSSNDDLIVRNNTFIDFWYPVIVNRPAFGVQYRPMCDLPNKTQHIIIEGNKFINNQLGGIQFSLNFLPPTVESRTFLIQNNKIYNSTINLDFFKVQISQIAELSYQNNFYNNVSLINGNHLFYFDGIKTNLTIKNETVQSSLIDDVYYIVNGNIIVMDGLLIYNVINSFTVTSTSSIFRVSSFILQVALQNIIVVNSNFNYGKAVQIETGNNMSIQNVSVTNSSFQFSNFAYLQQMIQLDLTNMTFKNISSQSQNIYIIYVPVINIVQIQSYFNLAEINLTQSNCSLISIPSFFMQSPQLGISNQIMMKNINISNNYLVGLNSFIYFGPVIYQNIILVIDNVYARSNIFEKGYFIQQLMNIKNFTIQNSIFLFNRGIITYFNPISSDKQVPLFIYIQHSFYFKNFGNQNAILQQTTNSILYAQNSTFIENYSLGRGSVFLGDFQGTITSFNNCTFKNNYAYLGGVFYVQYYGSVNISNSQVIQNFAIYGGFGYINNDGAVHIDQNTNLIQNSAINSCLLLIENTKFVSIINNAVIQQNDQVSAIIQKSELLLQNTSFSYKFIQSEYLLFLSTRIDDVIRGNNLINDFAINVIRGPVFINSSIIQNNDLFLMANTLSSITILNSTIKDCVNTGSVIQSLFSSVSLYDSQIFNISYSNQSALFYKFQIFSQSIFTINNSTINNVVGLLFQTIDSEVYFENQVTLKNLFNDDQLNSMIMFSSSSLSISDSCIKNISQIYASFIFIFDNSILKITNSQISNFDSSLWEVSRGEVKINKTIISNGSNYKLNSYYSTVFQISSANITILNSCFINISSIYNSPIVYIANSLFSGYSIQLYINNSEFINNSAYLNAGAIYAQYANVYIYQSNFINNSAQTLDGGALLLDCQNDINFVCFYEINQSQFINNSAFLNGGAIKYNQYKPFSNKNTFLNNQAQYGKDLASFPTQLSFQQSLRNLEIQLSEQAVQQLGFQNVNIFKIDLLQQSGNSISQNITFYIKDDIGQVIYTDSSSIATMSTLTSNCSIMKTKQVKAINGVIKFNDVAIIGNPGTDIFIKITTDSIKNFKFKNIYLNDTYLAKDLVLQVFIRYCNIGEYQTLDNKCVQCPDGFYNLNINSTQCHLCPDNAICQNGYQIMVNNGYWRQNVNSSTIYKCFSNESCLQNDKILCPQGYKGNLCGSCTQSGVDWYFQDSRFRCSKCDPFYGNWLKVFGLVLFIIFTIIIVLIIAYKNAKNYQQSIIYIRILVGYFQLITINSSLELNFTNQIQNFQQAISYTDKVYNQFFQIDCLIRQMNIQTHPVFIKIIFVALFPLALIIVLFIFWLLFKIRTVIKHRWRSFAQSSIIIIYVILPTIAVFSFQLINCNNIFDDNRSFLVMDLDITCWTDQH